MANRLTVSTTLDTEAEEMFRAWVSAQGRTGKTRRPAKVEPRVGGKFTAWTGTSSDERSS
jgi:hypothetical protein